MHARAGPLRTGRGADARASGGRPREYPRGGRARADVRALDAGRLPDGGGGGGQWRRLALVPALLAHGRRAGRFIRAARKAAGYTHLVITLDTTLLGWRPLDLDRGYSPFLENKGLANYTSDPVFRRKLLGLPAEDVAPIAAGLIFAGVFQNPGLSWDQLPLIRANWDGPILLKGIQSPRDAKLAVEHEIDGIIVSNHGGRQVDGAIASLDALGPIVKAVGEKMPVLFDSGIRTGRDAAVALALGADAVLIGRPYLYGLALDGQTGTRTVMQSLVDELGAEVRKAGHRSASNLSPSSLSRVR